MILVLTLALQAAAPVPARQPPQQTFWALVINDVPKGDVIAVLDGQHTWLPVTALDQAGLRRVGGDRRTLFNAPHVRLDSLAPDITYRRDMSEIVLRIIAAPQFFDTNVVVLQRDRPDGISYRVHHDGLHQLQRDVGSARRNQRVWRVGPFPLREHLRGLLLFSRGGRHLRRGFSTMTVDWASKRVRLQLGDTVARATPLGSAPTVAGVSLGRNYTLDPYYYRYPTPFIRGTATAPSDVEIYVNGALVRRLEVGPGPYRFDRLPVNAGLGDVSVVVRDPFGRQQRYDMTMYQPSGVLRRGEHDFQFVGAGSGMMPAATGVRRHAGHRVPARWRERLAHAGLLGRRKPQSRGRRPDAEHEARQARRDRAQRLDEPDPGRHTRGCGVRDLHVRGAVAQRDRHWPVLR